MKNPRSIRTAVVLLSTAFSMGLAFASPLEGRWVNKDPNTQSVPELEISVSGSGEGQLIWVGKTHPDNSTYGPFPLHLYGTSVGDRKERFSAHSVHETHFSIVNFFFQMDGKELVVDRLTRFTDDSNRTHYRETIVFLRK